MADEAAGAVLEAPVSTPAVESAEPTTDLTPVGDKPVQRTEPQDPDKLDKRNTPDAQRKFLKWLEENGGEHSPQANELRKLLGESKSYKTVYPTVREARESKMAIDAVGGVAKIAEMQQSSARYNEEIEMLKSGNPQLVDALYDESKEGVAKLAPHILSKIASDNPQEYGKIVKPHAFKFMASEGLPATLAAAVRAFKAGNTDQAASEIDLIVDWYNRNSKSAEMEKPPEQQAWEKERDAEREKSYTRDRTALSTAVLNYADGAIDKYLKPEAAKRGITDPEAYALLRKDAWETLRGIRDKDVMFKSSYRLNGLDHEKKKIGANALQFYNSYTDRFAKEAAEKAIRVRYGFVKPAGETAVDPAKKQSPTAAPTGATAQPDHTKMRNLFGRDGAMNEILAGRAVDKAGKKLIQQGKVWKYA